MTTQLKSTWGGNRLGKSRDAGESSCLYLNPINTGKIAGGGFDGGNIIFPWVPVKNKPGVIQLDGYSYGDFSIEIDWMVSNTQDVNVPSAPKPWGTTIQWHDIGQKRVIKGLPDADNVKKGHQTIKIKWSCGDSDYKEESDPSIGPGFDRFKNKY